MNLTCQSIQELSTFTFPSLSLWAKHAIINRVQTHTQTDLWSIDKSIFTLFFHHDPIPSIDQSCSSLVLIDTNPFWLMRNQIKSNQIKESRIHKTKSKPQYNTSRDSHSFIHPWSLSLQWSYTIYLFIHWWYKVVQIERNHKNQCLVVYGLDRVYYIHTCNNKISFYTHTHSLTILYTIPSIDF